MRLRLVLCVLVLGLPLAAFAQDEHKKALDFYRQGRYQDALVLLEESIASYPDWYFPILLKGQCNLKLGKYKKALENFNDALTLEPTSKEIPKIKYYIAQAYMASKDYPKAIQAYTDLAPLTPPSKLFDIYFNRGQSEMQVAKASEARRDNSKANSYFSKAIVSFSEALKNKAPKKASEIEALYQKAFCQYKIGNYKGGINSVEKSINAFKDVIAENPKEKRAHTFIVNLAFEIVDIANEAQKTQRYMDAVGYIDRFLGHWPGDTGMINKKGLALQGAKKYKEAIAVFNGLIKLNPKDGMAWFSLGSCQMAAKQYTNAISSFQKASANGESKNPNVYTYTAYCHQEQKTGCDKADIPRYQKAVEILEQGLKTVQGANRAVLQKDLGSKKGNLEVLQSNLATDNDNHQAVIDDIQALTNTIDGNKATLAKNQDLYLQQPTEELKAAIDEGKKAIVEDEKTLVDQYKQMDKYIASARKCGGNSAYPNYNRMVNMAKNRKK